MVHRQATTAPIPGMLLLPRWRGNHDGLALYERAEASGSTRASQDTQPIELQFHAWLGDEIAVDSAALKDAAHYLSGRLPSCRAALGVCPSTGGGVAAAMTYVVMLQLTRLLRRWLYSPRSLRIPYGASYLGVISDSETSFSIPR